MDRSNHYEAAFEGFLQWHKLCYIAIDETRRSSLGGEPVKSLDFIVHGDCGSRLLVDVKGRRFPGGSKEKPNLSWQCWTKQIDVSDMLRWQDQFGEDFLSLFVFIYLLDADTGLPMVPGDLWTWRGNRYYFRSVLVADYQLAMKQRSPKWETVDLPTAVFRQLAKPFYYFTSQIVPQMDENVPF